MNGLDPPAGTQTRMAPGLPVAALTLSAAAATCFMVLGSVVTPAWASRSLLKANAEFCRYAGRP